MALKPWREIAEPRDDVCKGNFQQAEFAADISSVHNGTASKDYLDPEAFFSMTYITAGMEELLKSVLKRISGTGGDPVIQLKTAFGGGKTHSLLAVYHLARQEKPLSNLNGISPILKNLNIIDLPKAKVVVIDGTNQNASQPRIYGNVHINTLWGDIAWQLGGAEAYEKVSKNDKEGTSPTKDIFISLLKEYGPAVILMDELVLYIRQFEPAKSYIGGTYNSNISFIQNITEAVKQVSNAVLLASLPESNREAGDEHGEDVLKTLEHYFGRLQAIWRPVETQESFEIVRRRLFKPIQDSIGRETVCKAFANYYQENPDQFPPETQESTYYSNILSAYPIHPEVFDRLYNDWSSLPDFQKTRGVLKLMAKVISQLWLDANTDYLIMPGNLPLASEVKNEFVSYLKSGWDPVIDGDVDGIRSEAFKLESNNPRLGQLMACRKVARTIFLGTAPGSQNKLKPGIDKKQIMLGVVQPGQQIAVFSDAVDQISNKFHFLNIGNEQYWFDIRQNLTKEMEERKKRFGKDELIIPEIRSILINSIKPSGWIEAVHVFTSHADIPDDKTLRLIVLPPGEHYNKSSPSMSTAQRYAKSITQNHGFQLRKYQNRLIFLAADANCIERFKDHIASMLAWQSIVEDYLNKRLILDNLEADNARKKAEVSEKTAKQSVRECYKHLIIPDMTCVHGLPPTEPEFMELSLNSGSPNVNGDIQKILKEHDEVIEEWAPMHLNVELSKWFWQNQDHISEEKYWDDSCRYLYLPRLSNESVLHKAIRDGSGLKDYFGIAYGYENGKYVDFCFGETQRSYISDKCVLIIDPKKAEEYSLTLTPPEQPRVSDKDTPYGATGGGSAFPLTQGNQVTTGGIVIPPTLTEGSINKRFFGSVDLNPVCAVASLMNINDEVIRRFTDIGADVTISLEIKATSKKGFGPDLQRTIRENCRQLKFDVGNTDFAEE